MADTKATIELFKYLVDTMKKMSILQNDFLDYISNNSENKSYIYVYNNILNKKSILKHDEELLKKLLKTFHDK